MKIICPHCSTENKIEYGENIVCDECNKTFAGHTYKRFKEPLISAVGAFVIGAIGAHEVGERFFEDNRYPINVEYELVDSCVNASRHPMNSQERKNKTEICICALEKTIDEITYEDLQKSESEFLTRFRDSIVSCR